MKKQLLLLVFTLISFYVLGQSTVYEIIHLKDGNTIQGQIIEEVSGDFVKIETPYKNILVISLEDIEDRSQELIKPVMFEKRIDLGYQLAQYPLDGRFDLNFTCSKRLNSVFSFGFGTGVRYTTGRFERAYIPVFTDLSANFKGRRSSKRFLSLNLGYSFDHPDANTLLDFMGRLSYGVGLKVGNGSMFRFGTTIEVQRFTKEFWNRMGFSPNYSAALGANVGFVF